MRIGERAKDSRSGAQVSRSDQQKSALCWIAWNWPRMRRVPARAAEHPAPIDYSIPHRELGASARRTSAPGTPRAV